MKKKQLGGPAATPVPTKPSPKKKARGVLRPGLVVGGDKLRPRATKEVQKTARHRKAKGRPTGCTPATIDAIAAAVRRGSSYVDAAQLSGISGTSFKAWMNRGEDGEEPYASFLAAVTCARAEAKAEAIANVRAGVLPGRDGAPDWKAEAWFLERVFPDEYGPQQAVNVKLKKEYEGAADRLKFLPPELYEKAIAALAGEDPNAATLDS